MMRQQFLTGMRSAMRTRSTALSSRQALAMPSQRFASTASPIEAAKSATQQVKSDAPWAITSLLVFGSMFIYITSPPSGGKPAASHHSHGPGLSITSTEASDDDEASPVDEAAYDNVSKIQDKPGEGAPSGDRHLAQTSLTADEGAHKQKPTKSVDDLQRVDDTTFKTGVAAAKEGHSDSGKIESNPKKVVADAHTARQDKAAKAKGEQPAEE